MKVLNVKQVADGTSERGPWTRQKIRLENPDAPNGHIDGQLFCHKFQPVPSVGDDLDVVEIKQPANPEKKPEKENHKKSGSENGKSRKEKPKTRASIAMQASQKVAVELAKFA